MGFFKKIKRAFTGEEEPVQELNELVPEEESELLETSDSPEQVPLVESTETTETEEAREAVELEKIEEVLAEPTIIETTTLLSEKLTE